ncbi:MAG: FISUMP domain-containing protein [Candidatus Neomarinimicrobiota bacterium]
MKYWAFIILFAFISFSCNEKSPTESKDNEDLDQPSASDTVNISGITCDKTTVTVIDTVKLECIANSSGTLHYHWSLKKGNTVYNSKIIDRADTSSSFDFGKWIKWNPPSSGTWTIEVLVYLSSADHYSSTGTGSYDIHYNYDSYGRINNIHYSSGNEIWDVYYEYDGYGNIKTKHCFNYDEKGELWNIKNIIQYIENVDIEVTPSFILLTNGQSRQFTFTFIYSDHGTQDVTSLATWSVSPGIAGSIDAKGLFTAGTNVGTETVTASYQGQTAQATITVVSNQQCGTMTDQDGNTYQTIIIGTQEWMAENLKATHYRNGEPCKYYENEAAIYGYLYDWYAVNDSRGIAPAGWHVPTDEEWKTLEKQLGMDSSEADDRGSRGTDEGGKLKVGGTVHWETPNIGATNESGFSALPGGYCSMGDYCEDLNYYAYFWTSTKDNIEWWNTWYRCLYYNSSSIWRNAEHPSYRFSVRLVKGESAPHTLSSINISPTISIVNPSETQQFTLTARYSDQATEDVTTSAIWSASPGTSGSIDANGLFTARSNTGTNSCTETVTASYQGQTAQATITIPGTMTDQDGNAYRTLNIGTQEWMTENLKVTHYRNGKPIPNVIVSNDWGILSTGAYCVYNNDENKAVTYGYLYNWYAVKDSQNIAPPGWHVPTDEDWQTLIDYLGGSNVAGGKLKEAGIAHWESPNTRIDNYGRGFLALPGGWRNGIGDFMYLGYKAFFWSSTETLSSGYAWYRCLYHDDTDMGRDSYLKKGGFSVRLVRD